MGKLVKLKGNECTTLGSIECDHGLNGEILEEMNAPHSVRFECDHG